MINETSNDSVVLTKAVGVIRCLPIGSVTNEKERKSALTNN